MEKLLFVVMQELMVGQLELLLTKEKLLKLVNQKCNLAGSFIVTALAKHLDLL
jgi:hypothetical protein